jgi:hypothetical protein
MQQDGMPVDRSDRYRDLLRKLFEEKRGGANRGSCGIALVAAHPGAGVTYTCDAIQELVNQSILPSQVSQPAPVRIFGSGYQSTVASYESYSVRAADLFIEASRIAITVDARELTRPGTEIGAIVAKSLEPRILRSPTGCGSSVYEALYGLSVEWEDGVNYRKECLQALGNIFRLVLLDVPSIRESSDIRSIAPLVDGVIVVVEANRTTTRQLRRLTETIEDEGGTIFGVLLNKRTYPIPEPIYKYLEGAGLT